MLLRPAYGRFLPLLLAGALLLCHGLFGALHLAPDPPTYSSLAGGHGVGHGVGHAAEGHDGAGHGEQPAQHDPDVGYFAVLLVSLLGAVALRLLRHVPRRAGTLLAPRNSAGYLPHKLLARSRGPTPPLLQVFRL